MNTNIYFSLEEEKGKRLIFSRFFIGFPFDRFRRTQYIYHDSGGFYKKMGILLGGVSDL